MGTWATTITGATPQAAVGSSSLHWGHFVGGHYIIPFYVHEYFAHMYELCTLLLLLLLLLLLEVRRGPWTS